MSPTLLFSPGSLVLILAISLGVLAFSLNSVAIFASGYIACWTLFSAYVLLLARRCSLAGDFSLVLGHNKDLFSSSERDFIRRHLFYFSYRFTSRWFNAVGASLALGAYLWIGLAFYAKLWIHAAILICLMLFAWNKLNYITNLYGMLQRGANAGHRPSAEEFAMLQRIAAKQKALIAAKNE